MSWTLDPESGVYSSIHKSPTGIPSDPPLAAHGVDQSQQLAKHLSTLNDPPITTIYSSPYYRCLQTLEPYVSSLPPELRHVKGDNGVGEWHGYARFTHPSPGTPELLNRLFAFYDRDHTPTIIPSKHGERIEELHERCAYAMHRIIAAEDSQNTGDIVGQGKDKERAILICTHAASMIAIGRALTGQVPADLTEDDFKTYTCGLSKFTRRELIVPKTGSSDIPKWTPGMGIPEVEWKNGVGIGGGWDCIANSNCDFLDDGAERTW